MTTALETGETFLTSRYDAEEAEREAQKFRVALERMPKLTGCTIETRPFTARGIEMHAVILIMAAEVS